ncbi:MAG: type III secretion system export apparatus subunit SctT [Rhizobiales bacterium]|nr:type III secretion system export apparatus subunit SctT [Hyphomicrobiales bacterium]
MEGGSGMILFDEAFQEIITLGYSFLIAMALAMARAAGMVIILPVFVRTGITGILRGSVVIAIALSLVPHVMVEVSAAGEVGALVLTVVLLKEGFIGFLLGFALGIPFWGVEAAGEVVDFQRGLMGATISDPSQTSEASVTGTFLVLTMITLFFIADGMMIVIDTLYQTYRIWPLFDLSPELSIASAASLFKLIDDIMRLAFVIAGPVMIAMFLGDAVLAAITRFAPQLNVFVLSMGVKSAIFVAMMPLYAVFILDHIGDAFAPLHHVADQFREMIR